MSFNLAGRIECTVPAAVNTPESTPILSLNLNLPPVIISVPSGPGADPIPATWSFYSSLILAADLR